MGGKKSPARMPRAIRQSTPGQMNKCRVMNDLGQLLLVSPTGNTIMVYIIPILFLLASVTPIGVKTELSCKTLASSFAFSALRSNAIDNVAVLGSSFMPLASEQRAQSMHCSPLNRLQLSSSEEVVFLPYHLGHYSQYHRGRRFGLVLFCLLVTTSTKGQPQNWGWR